MTKHEKILERISRLRLLDDIFMKKVFEDKACTQLLLRIIMQKDDLVVEQVQTEYSVKNLQGRSARLDILASDRNGVQYNVEVQRAESGAGPRRARYNSSLMDVNITDPGDDYEALPECYVIFITETDVLRYSQPMYLIERTCRGLDVPFNDGSHIIYVNAQVQDSTPLGLLMQDFTCTNAADMHYKELAQRVRYFKEDGEGVKTMCWFTEEVLQEGRDEKAIETARRMLIRGKMTHEEIAEDLQLPISKVEALAQEMKAAEN